jgi:hypothetical protein
MPTWAQPPLRIVAPEPIGQCLSKALGHFNHGMRSARSLWFSVQLGMKIRLNSKAIEASAIINVDLIQYFEIRFALVLAGEVQTSRYLPARDFGQHPVVVVSGYVNHTHEGHPIQCDVPCVAMENPPDSRWDYRCEFPNISHSTRGTVATMVEGYGWAEIENSLDYFVSSNTRSWKSHMRP